MRFIGKILSLLVILATFAGCSSVTVEVGQEAVLTRKPIFGSAQGLVSEPLGPGRHFTAITTDSVVVDMQPKQFPIHLEDFMSSDGVPLDFDAVLRLRVTDSVKMVKHFGKDWYVKNVEAEFANRARQAVRKHGMNETAINTAAIEEIDTEITDALIEYFKSSGLPVELIQVTVGRANPPDAIKGQRIETARAQQQALTERELELAEVKRKQREIARADADNAYRVAMQLDPDQFLRLETIKMQREVCSHAPGCTFILGGADVQPVVNLKSK